jgi:hypothetical protein
MPWFENVAAPLLSILIVLVLLYCLAFFVPKQRPSRASLHADSNKDDHP